MEDATGAGAGTGPAAGILAPSFAKAGPERSIRFAVAVICLLKSGKNGLNLSHVSSLNTELRLAHVKGNCFGGSTVNGQVLCIHYIFMYVLKLVNIGIVCKSH